MNKNKKMSFKEVLIKLRKKSHEADLKRKEYLKKRGERLSILNYDK